MKKFLIIASLAALTMPAFAETEENEKNTSADATEIAAADEKPAYGYKLTDFASKPKFGAYVIGTYKYSDQEGANGGPGFNVRLFRAYVDGSIFSDFNYRVQMEFNGTPHIKDFYLEWKRFPEFSVKIGQFKRAFTFENPYNPWDVGVGDYSQGVKKLAGFGDRCGEASMGGRDQGIQFQGDLLPMGEDHHRFIHYQLGIYNGQGINRTDSNKDKDIIGTIQFQPIKDLYIGAFGWKGNWTNGTSTIDRNRYAISGKYEHNNWSARAEYIHSNGYKASSVDAAGNLIDQTDTGEADAWYATVGVPVKPWFKVYVKYDTYRDMGNSDYVKTIYSLAPNFRLHKNLNFQIEYRYNSVKIPASTTNFNEIWFEYYFRF